MLHMAVKRNTGLSPGIKLVDVLDVSDTKIAKHMGHWRMRHKREEREGFLR